MAVDNIEARLGRSSGNVTIEPESSKVLLDSLRAAACRPARELASDANLDFLGVPWTSSVSCDAVMDDELRLDTDDLSDADLCDADLCDADLCDAEL